MASEFKVCWQRSPKANSNFNLVPAAISHRCYHHTNQCTFEKNWFKLNTFAVKNVNIMHFSSEYWELKAGFTRDLQFGQHRLSQHMRGEREEIETLSADKKWSAPNLQTRIQWQCGPGPIKSPIKSAQWYPSDQKWFESIYQCRKWIGKILLQKKAPDERFTDCSSVIHLSFLLAYSCI